MAAPPKPCAHFPPCPALSTPCLTPPLLPLLAIHLEPHLVAEAAPFISDHGRADKGCRGRKPSLPPGRSHPRDPPHGDRLSLSSPSGGAARRRSRPCSTPPWPYWPSSWEAAPMALSPARDLPQARCGMARPSPPSDCPRAAPANGAIHRHHGLKPVRPELRATRRRPSPIQAGTLPRRVEFRDLTSVLSRAARRRRWPLAVLPRAARACSRGRVRRRRPRRRSRKISSPQPLLATAPTASTPSSSSAGRPARRAARSGELPVRWDKERTGGQRWIDRSVRVFFFLPCSDRFGTARTSQAQQAMAQQRSRPAGPFCLSRRFFFSPGEQLRTSITFEP